MTLLHEFAKWFLDLIVIEYCLLTSRYQGRGFPRSLFPVVLSEKLTRQ